MKRVLVFVIALLVVALAGCGKAGTKPASGKTTTPPATIAATATITVDDTDDTDDGGADTSTPLPTITADASTGAIAPLSMDDFQLVMDDGSFSLNSDVQPLLTYLGDDYTQTTDNAPDKTYQYSDFTIIAHPSGSTDVLESIEFMADSFATTRDITIGSTLDDIVAAYGNGYFIDDDTIIYMLSGAKKDDGGAKIYFEMADNAVTVIGMYAPPAK